MGAIRIARDGRVTVFKNAPVDGFSSATGTAATRSAEVSAEVSAEADLKAPLETDVGVARSQRDFRIRRIRAHTVGRHEREWHTVGAAAFHHQAVNAAEPTRTTAAALQASDAVAIVVIATVAVADAAIERAIGVVVLVESALEPRSVLVYGRGRLSLAIDVLGERRQRGRR